MKIKYETLSILRFAPPALNVGVSFDISDAYHHLELHPTIQQFFTFQVGEYTYRCRGLPFGWSLSPYVFTKFMRPVIAALRSPSLMGPRLQYLRLYQLLSDLPVKLVSVFLDDILALLCSILEAEQFVQAAIELFQLLGLKYHPQKSTLRPTPRIVHLGFLLDIPKRMFVLTERQY